MGPLAVPLVGTDTVTTPPAAQTAGKRSPSIPVTVKHCDGGAGLTANLTWAIPTSGPGVKMTCIGHSIGLQVGGWVGG